MESHRRCQETLSSEACPSRLPADSVIFGMARELPGRHSHTERGLSPRSHRAQTVWGRVFLGARSQVLGAETDGVAPSSQTTLGSHTPRDLGALLVGQQPSFVALCRYGWFYRQERLPPISSGSSGALN